MAKRDENLKKPLRCRFAFKGKVYPVQIAKFADPVNSGSYTFVLDAAGRRLTR
jgi:hypothetical protein